MTVGDALAWVVLAGIAATLVIVLLRERRRWSRLTAKQKRAEIKHAHDRVDL